MNASEKGRASKSFQEAFLTKRNYQNSYKKSFAAYFLNCLTSIFGEANMQSAYGASLAGADFDIVNFLKQPQTILRCLSWVSDSNLRKR